MVDLLGGPAADMAAAMQEDFKEADDARVMDLDAGIADCADADRKSEALQQREVDMDVEPLRLKAGEAVCSAGEPAPAKGGVVDREEGIVGLAEADLCPLQVLLDEAVAVEIVGGLEREERGHPHHHRAQGFVA